jgi:hypothetical protein
LNILDGMVHFVGSFRNLHLTPLVAEQANLGDTVNCHVVGDYMGGFAIIMRSRNPFDKRRFGFYAQPENADLTRERDYSIWQAPADAPKRGVVHWGPELLHRKEAKVAEPEVAAELIQALLQRAAR